MILQEFRASLAAVVMVTLGCAATVGPTSAWGADVPKVVI